MDISSMYKTTNIKDNYKFDKVLGEYYICSSNRGSFAVVRKAIRKSDNQEVAIKIIDKYPFSYMKIIPRER